jgi:hypothetical protein
VESNEKPVLAIENENENESADTHDAECYKEGNSSERDRAQKA